MWGRGDLGIGRDPFNNRGDLDVNRGVVARGWCRAMAKIDGGEMLVRALEAEGVREIFTLHGGHLDAIYAACGRHDFRVIDTRHEQAPAHMAGGGARTTRRRGVWSWPGGARGYD